MLQGLNHLCALCCSFQYLHICLILGTSTPHCCFTSPEKMGSITSLSVLITLLTVQPWILFASWWQGHIVWLMVSFASSRTHRSFSLAQGVVALNVQDLAFSHAKLHEVPIRPFVQPVRACLGGSTTLCCISCFPLWALCKLGP